MAKPGALLSPVHARSAAAKRRTGLLIPSRNTRFRQEWAQMGPENSFGDILAEKKGGPIAVEREYQRSLADDGDWNQLVDMQR
jgi:hypothetical protein